MDLILMSNCPIEGGIPMNKQNKNKWRKTEAVSPVIATLMLVLIAVGSSGAFYVWHDGYQQDTLSEIQNFKTMPSLTIGGSSLIHPFNEQATDYYKATHHQEIRNSKGGNEAGITAVQNDIVDIACCTRSLTTDEKQNLEQFHIGNISLSLITHPNNPHHLHSINNSFLADLYNVNGNNKARSTFMNISGNGIINWSQLPSHVEPFSGSCASNVYLVDANISKYDYEEENMGVYLLRDGETNYRYETIDQLEELLSGNYQFTVDSSTYPDGDYIFYFTCSGNQPIEIYDTAEEDTFEEFFCFEILESKKTTLEESNILCSQITADYISLISEVRSNSDAIGFIPEPLYDNTIHQIDEIKLPLYYITKKPTTGLRSSFVDYIRLPQINQEICEKIEFVSIYS